MYYVVRAFTYTAYGEGYRVIYRVMIFRNGKADLNIFSLIQVILD